MLRLLGRAVAGTYGGGPSPKTGRGIFRLLAISKALGEFSSYINTCERPFLSARLDIWLVESISQRKKTTRERTRATAREVEKERTTPL